jgi:hypothetical protein
MRTATGVPRQLRPGSERFSNRSRAAVPNVVMNASPNDQRGESTDAARIEDLVMQLPSQARVRITMRNGDVFTGTVTERPATQLIRTGVAEESINAMVRLDDPTAPPWNVYLWLSDIERVEMVGAQN